MLIQPIIEFTSNKRARLHPIRGAFTTCFRRASHIEALEGSLQDRRGEETFGREHFERIRTASEEGMGNLKVGVNCVMIENILTIKFKCC